MIGPRHRYPPGTLLAAHRDLELALLALAAAVLAASPRLLRRLFLRHG